MKKIKLRSWFKYTLLIITLLIGIIIVSECETIKIGILKAIIGLPIIFINCYILSIYGGLNE